MVTSLLKITRFTIISKSKCLIMRARRLQQAFTRSILPFWNQENRLRAAKDKRHLLSCSMFIIVCSWDPIIAGFREKFLRFKTRKWRRQFVFFRRCHRWVSRATVVVKSETAGINVIFAFSQRWVFHYSIWPIARESHLRYSSLASS